MRTLLKSSVIAAFVVSLIVASGCVQSPLTPGANYKILLAANPTTVSVDPSATPPTATSTLTATVLSDLGVPQKGYAVYFTTDGGLLSSASQPVKTDSNGNAHDTLTVGTSDPASINVTATSTTLTATVKVTKSTVDPCAANTAPTAGIVVTGTPDPGAVGATVRFSASASSSTDPPRNVITGYQWTCVGGTPFGSLTADTVACDYVVASVTKIYTVTLVVKDDGLGNSPPTCQKSSVAATQSVTVSVLP